MERDHSKTTRIAALARGLEDCGCPPVEVRLGESLDIVITPAELEELKAELQGCPPCLEFVESLKTTVKLCRDFGIEQAPTPLASETRRQMVDAYDRMLARRASAGAGR
jgi:hypothetical protein